MAAAVKKADDQMVKVKVKKADMVSDGQGGFVEEGGEIEVTDECAVSLKEKGLA